MKLRLPFPRVCLTISSAVCMAALGKPPVAMAGPGKSHMTPATEVPGGGRDQFYLSAGWMWRETGGGSFRTASRSHQLRLPRLVGGPFSSPPQTGPAGAYADRYYLDGSVRVDAGTEYDGATSAWSYQETSQVEGDELRYRATGARRSNSSGMEFQDPEDFSFDGEGGAPFVELGWERAWSPVWSLGATFQWSFLDLDGSRSQSDFAAWQEAREYASAYTDTYELQGIIPPQAPYEGAGSGFGPLINNIPSGRQGGEALAGRQQVRFFNRIDQTFDIKLHTLSLGPVVAAKAGDWQFRGGAGLALNLVDWEAEQVETLYIREGGRPPRVFKRWSDRTQDLAWLPGFYFQGGISWQLTPKVFLTGFGRYDWSRTLEEQVGESSFTFDPGGWSVGASAGIKF